MEEKVYIYTYGLRSGSQIEPGVDQIKLGNDSMITPT